MSPRNFLQAFFLPTPYLKEEYLTKLKVIVINIIMPSSIIFGWQSIISNWDLQFDGHKPEFQSWSDFYYMVGLVVTYGYFLISKKLNLYLASYTIITTLYFSIGYYFSAEGESTLLWFYVFSVMIFFFNDLKYAIINFILFYSLIISISVLRFDELSSRFYSHNYLKMFFFSFTIYSIVLLGYEFFKRRLLHQYSQKKSELEEKNIALASSLSLQEKLYKELKAKEKKNDELTDLNSSIIESLGEIIYDYNIPNDEFTWNDALYTVLGYSNEEIGNDLENFLAKVHPHDRQLFIQELEDAKESGINFSIDSQIMSNNGYLWMQNRGNVIYDTEGNATRIIGILSNISNKKLIDTKQLQAVVQGVDLERKRIAGEIHDSLGQTLIAASITLNSMSDAIQNQLDQEQFGKYKSVEKMINDAIQEGRDLSHNLMPKSLEDYGLVPSLQSLINKINLTKKVSSSFYTNLKNEGRLPIEVEVNLYRVAQEAFNNIIKHSEAKNVVLQLLHFDNEITFTIEDDGKGFIKPSDKNDNGLGLQNIQNRISSIGGTIHIDSHKDYGTLFTIEINMDQKLFSE